MPEHVQLTSAQALHHCRGRCCVICRRPRSHLGSLRHKSLVRIIAVRCAHSPLIFFTKIRTPSAQCILTRPLPRIYRTFQQYGACDSPRERQCRQSDVAENRVWCSEYPTQGQLNGSTINVTYDSVNDPACCECHFLCPALLFQEGKGGEKESNLDSSRQGHNPDWDMPQAHAGGSRPTRPSHGNLRSHVVTPFLLTDDLEFATHHFSLFG